jgi:hypothetical protein
MGIHRGPNIIKDDLVFGYDTGYGVADNTTATRFYPGEFTINHVTTNLETVGTDGSGQSSVGTRTTIAPNHVRIVDVGSNTRQTHLIQGLTASTTYTVSIQFKKITGTPTFRFQLQGYSGSSYVNTIKFTSTAETGLEDIEGWQTAEWTFTLPSNCNALRIWWQDGADYTTYTHSFELKNPQLEAKSHVTPYVSGTRSSTQSLIDLKRTADIDVSNISFNSTGQPDFDGTDDIITQSRIIDTASYSAEFVFKADVNTSGTEHWLGSQYPGTGRVIFDLYTNNRLRNFIDGTSINGATTIETGTWYHAVFTRNSLGVAYIYLNGIQDATGTLSTTTPVNDPFDIGGSTTLTRWFNGNIAVVKIYNTELTAAQAAQNFNAYKNRFNI